MPDEAIHAIVERTDEMPVGSQMLLAAWSGALARVTSDDSPLAGRDTAFIVHPFAFWEDPAEDERAIAWARSYRDDLEPWALDAVYLNFIGDEGERRVRAGFGPNHERLARIKAEWDPENVFRRNRNIRPLVPAES